MRQTADKKPRHWPIASAPLLRQTVSTSRYLKHSVPLPLGIIPSFSTQKMPAISPGARWQMASNKATFMKTTLKQMQPGSRSIWRREKNTPWNERLMQILRTTLVIKNGMDLITGKEKLTEKVPTPSRTHGEPLGLSVGCSVQPDISNDQSFLVFCRRVIARYYDVFSVLVGRRSSSQFARPLPQDLTERSRARCQSGSAEVEISLRFVPDPGHFMASGLRAPQTSDVFPDFPLGFERFGCQECLRSTLCGVGEWGVPHQWRRAVFCSVGIMTGEALTTEILQL